MTKILYVEDNDDNIYMITRRLGRSGYEVVVAKDGGKGLAMAQSETPSLILMDLDLPVVDGWEATRRLKASLRESFFSGGGSISASIGRSPIRRSSESFAS